MSTVTPDIDSEHSFAKRWQYPELFVNGYVVAPTLFFENCATLDLSAGESLFVLQLMVFKWDTNAPFPGYKKIAQRMGVSDKMVRRYAQSLEEKGYLQRLTKRGYTNRFDLMGLFDALLPLAAKAKKEAKKEAAKTRKRLKEKLPDNTPHTEQKEKA